MSKRLILLTIGILTLFAVSAFATETRVATMGNNGLYLKDDAGIFFYPGTMSQYQKMVIAEHYSNQLANDYSPFAYPAFRRVGIILPAWGNGTLAIFAGEDTENFNVGGAFPGPGFDAPTTRLLVGYGMNTGNSSLGFQVDFSGVRDESPQALPQPAGATNIFTASTWGFGFGLSTPMGDLNNLDFGFRLRIGSFEEKADSSDEVLNNKSDGNMALSFVLRDYYALNDYMNLVPVGALGIASEKNIDYVGGLPDSNLYKFNTTAIEAGLALQTKPTESSEIIGGAGWRYFKLRERVFDNASGSGTPVSDESFSATALPFVWLGFEAAVKNWMHFRLGVEKQILSEKEKRDEPTIAADHERDEWKITDSPLSYAVGAAFHAGPVTMDVMVENEWFNMGPNFLSGNNLDDFGDSDNVALFPRVSFTYNFK